VLTVVHVLPYMAEGGTEKHVLTLMRGQRSRYRTLLLAPRGKLSQEFLKLGTHYVEFPELKGNVARKVRIFRETLAGMETQYPIDILHVHAAHEFLKFCRRTLPRTPIIFHLSAHQGSFLSRWFNYGLSARLSSRFADRLIAVSEEEKRIAARRGYPEGNIRVIHNGYEAAERDDAAGIADLRKRYGLNGHTVIGNIGRFNRTKRLDLLIRAFAMLSDSGMQGVKLLLIGDGPQRQSLESLVRSMHLEERVHFTGFIPRGDRILRVLDIFVLPTTYEGCSNVLVEAMAKGLPIVTTDIASVRWMFHPGVDALLFKKNSLPALYGVIRSLVESEEKRRCLQENVIRNYESRFTAEIMIERTDALYRELCGEKLPGGAPLADNG
jgi:glycosyltransferase involved in cell wall biosynthesis